MTVSVVIPFRNSSPERMRNLGLVLQHLSGAGGGWEILVVEQDETPALEIPTHLQGINHIFAENQGEFNKAWAVNIGVLRASGDIIVVSDADMIVPASSLVQAIEGVRKKLEFIRPYRRLIDLSETQTDELARGELLPDASESREYDRNYTGEHLCLAGGVYITRRSLFLEIGGMDERFRGWGGEDDAFSHKILRRAGFHGIARDITAWHLWHPRAGRDPGGAYADNVKLLSRIMALDNDEFWLDCRKQKSTMGRLDSYQTDGSR